MKSVRMRRAPGTGKKTVRKAAIALLLALAAGMAMAHLRLPHAAHYWRMDTSAAALRAGERMSVSLPAGDVDVNSGSVQELQRLMGVGPSLAQAIVAEREQNGSFSYPEDLISVPGIGPKTLEQMRTQLKLQE